MNINLKMKTIIISVSAIIKENNATLGNTKEFCESNFFTNTAVVNIWKISINE